MSVEEWENIPEFNTYDISSFGRIFNNRTQRMMKTSHTPHGHVKITLKADWTPERFTRSVAKLVAEAFVEPPSPLCDCVMILDGNLDNVAAENLVWRPRWFEWQYVRQFKIAQPTHYQNLRVANVITGVEYNSIMDAAIAEGLLFHDIWRSTYTEAKLFPEGAVFEVIGEYYASSG